MRILFLTQFYWPEIRTAPLNLATLAEDLQDRGHDVTVITGFPNHPFGRVYEGYRIKLWQWDNVRGVKVLRVPLFPDHSLSLIQRAVNYSSFALSATLTGSLLTRRLKADVIFVYLPPLTIGMPAAFLSRLHHASVVYWMTDLWPENLIAAGAQLKPFIYNFIRYIENWVYNQGKIVCVNSPGLIDNLMGKGVDHKKIEVVPDWADENIFFPTKYDEDLACQFGLSEKFNIIYGGNLGKVQGLEVVVEAAQSLQDLKDVQFVFIGDGTESEKLKKRVSECALRNVIFIPRQPPEQIHRFFALADVLYVHLKREPVFEMQIPSKIIAYLACGRPVLCAVHGVAAKIVQDASAGVFCTSEDALILSTKVRYLYEMPRSELEKMGQNGRQAYLAEYTRKIQVSRVENILKKAAEVS
jgi:glycosyltransferase involved in cell wall biosynthesis